jgi:hypothetical protein
MRSYFYLLLLCAFASQDQAFAQVTNDRWLSRDGAIIKYDKIEHALGFFAVQSALTKARVNKKVSLPLLILSGILWEIKDDLLDYRQYGAFGGNGFSWKDLAADGIGIGLSIKLVHSKQNSEARLAKAEKVGKTKRAVMPH